MNVGVSVTQDSDDAATRRPLDSLDRKIIEMLEVDCQATNRAIAQHLSVTEATVSSRISSLVEGRRIRFALQRNLFAFGYDTLFFGEIAVHQVPVEDVCAAIRKIPEIIIVSVVAGIPQLVVMGRARSGGEVSAITRTQLRKIPGVRRVEISVVLAIPKFAAGIAELVEE